MTVSIEATQAARPTEDWSFPAEGVTKVYGGTLRANDAITTPRDRKTSSASE